MSGSKSDLKDVSSSGYDNLLKKENSNGGFPTVIKMNQSKNSLRRSSSITKKPVKQTRFRRIGAVIRIKNQKIREFLAEILGSFIFISFGLASIAQFKFFKRDDSSYQSTFLSVNLAFGFGIMAAILVVGKVSGAHLNPAVSFAMLLIGRMSFTRFLAYVAGQFIGSFLASILVFMTYFDSLRNYKGGMFSMDMAGIFATYPHPHLSTLGGLLDQIIGTVFLILVVLALTDKKNAGVGFGMVALSVGFTISAIGLAFGHNSGFAINPARDLGPRFFTFIAGWGTQVFTTGNYFFWIPIVGPMVI